MAVTDSGAHGKQPATGRLLLAVHREQGSVVLVLEGGEDLELAPDAVPSDLPEPGGVIGGDLLVAVRAAASRKQAARRIFSILDRRLVPPARVRRKLVEEGLPAAAIDAVLEQMAAQGLYSDRTYADAWCRDALGGKAVGRWYLETKLRQKGIAPAVARDAAKDALDRESEGDLAERAAAARWRRLRGPVDRKAEAKVIRYLQGRGFDVGLAVKAMRATRPDDPDHPDDGASTNDEERS